MIYVPVVNQSAACSAGNYTINKRKKSAFVGRLLLTFVSKVFTAFVFLVEF